MHSCLRVGLPGSVKLVCSTKVPIFHQTVIADIKSLISRDWNVTISHVFRESNACASMLVHLGVDQNDRIRVFQEPPMRIGPLLLVDAVGVTFIR